ncbi:MAG: hypothetical protein R8M38_08280 [Mariprofundaceae bacterium]
MFFIAPSVIAAPADSYRSAMAQAAKGQDEKAISWLHGAAATLPANHPWQQRMLTAASMLKMRQQLQQRPEISSALPQAQMVHAYLKQKPAPESAPTWLAGGLASLIPGSGHLYLGRTNDAMVAAFMVWPLLILTLWAARRQMGPVTVFFAMTTAWLWSGTVFSAVSLAERGSMEAYMLWWQGSWQASGLPGRPW